MFEKNADFYPTPRQVARDMWKELSRDVKYILEPSAGMGDLADVMKQPYTWEEAEAEVNSIDGHGDEHEDRKYRRARARVHPEDYGDKVEIDCIESEPNFCHVLNGKEYPVVGYDWLAYNGVCYYDAIVMNPPFSNGDEHLLKAWDFLYKGEIVCLLNAETLSNPYTANRKRLVKLIADNEGRVTNIGKAFSTAERPTNVDVVRVYLKKNPPDDTFDLWATETTEEANPEVEQDKDPDFVAIRDNLANIVRWYEMANKHFIKGFEELRRGFLYLQQNKIGDYGAHERKNYSAIAGEALTSSHGARADFLRKHRRDAWEAIFIQMNFHKWLDSKQQDRMMRDVARDMHLPFTVENIKATVENIFLSRKKLFDESVANVFDELCSHSFENGEGPEVPAALKSGRHRGEGWKTNDSYKVNQKLIFPYGCEYDSRFGGGFRTKYGDADRIYVDLDRILCVLDAQPFENCFTVEGALRRAFDRHRTQPGTTESEYFQIRFFKKGTVHLKWKRLDLLESFNKTAAAGKKWLGAETSYKKAEWRGKPEYYCEHHGHEYENGVCSRCHRPEVDTLAAIPCEYCRVVAEYTGRIQCPIHAEVVPVAQSTQLALCSPEAA